MYEELVKRLRELASIPEHCNAVEDCSQCTNESICDSFTNKLITEVVTEAADAIEELNMIATSNERSMKAWAGTAVKAAEKIPRWIPVKEPPKEGKPVFVHIPCRYRKQESIPMIAFWEQGQWKEYESHRLVYNITHWMPLPEPPKEET